MTLVLDSTVVRMYPTYMEITTNPEAKMTDQQMLAKADQLDRDADLLYMSLLAPSMTETAIRDEAKALREQAARA